MVAAKYTINTHYNKFSESIKKLERYQEMFNRKSFLSNEIAIDAIRKALEDTIEIMLTIGSMVINEQGLKKPEKNDEVFQILTAKKIISADLGGKLWGLGGFRNILVHNYITVDLNLVYDYLEEGVPVFKEFAKKMKRFV